MNFTKPATSCTDQIDTLRKRGLIITNEKYAEHCLKHISYYRLVGYWWPFQSDKANHIFKPNSKFETVIKVYNFDSELRTLLFDVIERIEVSFRCKLAYHLSHEFDPWWFENQNLFIDIGEYKDSLKAIDRELGYNRKKEVFLLEHYKKYNTDTRRPPAWKTLEVLSLGTLSKLYGNLKNSCKAKDLIASEFGTANHTYLHSWLQTITQIRNICAHHGRLWNKNLPGRPKLLSKPPNGWVKNSPPVNEHHMLYVHLCCMKYLFNVIHPGNNFTYRLFVLLKNYPNIDLNALGMSKHWHNEPLWNNKVSMGKIIKPTYHKAIYVFKNITSKIFK